MHMTMEEFIARVRNGRIFTLEFVKRTTGEFRVMNARLGVKAYVKGVGLKFDPKAKDLLGVFDLQKGEYRFINLRAPITLKLEKEVYDWDFNLQLFVKKEEDVKKD